MSFSTSSSPSISPTSTNASEKKKSQRLFEDYFVGPRNIQRHSKWPRALCMHGSVAPKLALPTFLVTVWSAVLVVFSQKVHDIHVNPIVLTVLGIVVGLALNFRSSTAYERYMEGRKLWASLTALAQNLARVVWVHAEEREGELGKADLMGKITFLNMIIAFSIALKHKLRFEPYIQYTDLNELVSHLDTFAKAAGRPSRREKRMRSCKRLGELLKVPMAKSNPRKELKRATRPLGNLPLEIMTYMSGYINEIILNDTLSMGMAQTHAFNNMQSLNEILAHSDRVLNTPLPLAYSIAIAQITWIYLITLPVQLVNLLGYTAIPVSAVSAYIILGIHAIGNEIENPFGSEVNDLPMEDFCTQIASDVTIIASNPPPKPHKHFLHPENKPLYPISSAGTEFWLSRDIDDIREALNTRAGMSKGVMWKRQISCVAMAEDDHGQVEENHHVGHPDPTGHGGHGHIDTTMYGGGHGHGGAMCKESGSSGFE
ncbi:membrane protein [Dendryphion nanum]|uniref:Membrane protein n=1 Tax=Dendryphion nanum TaxID=256645 RepID=A0A9P9IPP4_9PLEO|nr:membrane protein [Dendryphion nanum]